MSFKDAIKVYQGSQLVSQVDLQQFSPIYPGIDKSGTRLYYVDAGEEENQTSLFVYDIQKREKVAELAIDRLDMIVQVPRKGGPEMLLHDQTEGIQFINGS